MQNISIFRFSYVAKVLFLSIVIVVTFITTECPKINCVLNMNREISVKNFQE